MDKEWFIIWITISTAMGIMLYVTDRTDWDTLFANIVTLAVLEAFDIYYMRKK